MQEEQSGYGTRTVLTLLFCISFDPQEEEPKKWENGLSALNDALAKEREVTNSIRNVISVCENNGNDYHISDHLTGEFLEEQYRGMRELAGKISTLSKMMKNSGPLGLFLYDKELLA